MFGAPPIEDARLLAAVVEAKGGPWYFKLLGPADTVGDWKKEFVKLPVGTVVMLRCPALSVELSARKTVLKLSRTKMSTPVTGVVVSSVGGLHLGEARIVAPWLEEWWIIRG